jgi:hypothetical protein
MELTVAAFLKLNKSAVFYCALVIAAKKDEPPRVPATRAASLAMAWSGGLLKTRMPR